MEPEPFTGRRSPPDVGGPRDVGAAALPDFFVVAPNLGDLRGSQAGPCVCLCQEIRRLSRRPPAVRTPAAPCLISFGAGRFGRLVQ